MKAITHKRLGIHLIGQFMADNRKLQQKAFLLGCIQPDKNPATYVKGSVRQALLRGHNWSSARQYIKKLCDHLEEKRCLTLLDYYKFGKLIHYIADAFTYPHNDRFKGTLAQHRRYEAALDQELAALITKPVVTEASAFGSLFAFVQLIHRRYLLERPCPFHDARYILRVTGQITGTVSKAK